VALEAKEWRDQLIRHLLVIHEIEHLLIHGIAAILVMLLISASEVDLRTHRLKKPAPPMLPVWDGSMGLTNPPLFSRNISNIRLPPPAPLLLDSKVKLLVVARLLDDSEVGVESEVVGERVPEEDLRLRVAGQASLAASRRCLVVLPLAWVRQSPSVPQPPSSTDGRCEQRTGRRGLGNGECVCEKG
jgi:hypothetical protein